MNEEPTAPEAEPAPEWPRDITVRPIEEVAKRLLNCDFLEGTEGYDRFLFSWGYELYENVTIESWDELNLPEGYELASENEREEYGAHLHSKKRKS